MQALVAPLQAVHLVDPLLIVDAAVGSQGLQGMPNPTDYIKVCWWC